MSTADYRDALTRRMEQIAAASGDEPDNEGAALAALVGALRADIGVVRAELGALRSETGAVQAELDGLGERLSEVPVTTGARLDELTGTLTDAVGGRVDAVADEVHRTLASARDRDARTSAQVAVALEDARGALESRLAALEDALEAMSERIEALSRDGASTTTAKLATLEAGVGALTERVEREGRDNAELVVDRVRDLTGTRLTELEDALHGRLSATLRLRDDELRRELLAAADAAREQAVQDHAAVVALADTSPQVLAALAGLSGELAARDAAAAAALAGVQSGVQGTVESVRGQLVSAMTALRSDVSSEVATLTPRVDELAVAGTATREAVASLRGDLLARVEEVRDRVIATSADSTGELLAALTDSRAENAETARALREDLLDRVGEMHAAVAGSLVEVTRSLAGSTSTASETAARVGALTSVGEDSRRIVEERLAVLVETMGQGLTVVDTTVTRRADEVLAAVTMQADQLRDGLGSRVEELAAAVAAGTVATTEAGETVTGLVRASQAHRTDVERLLEKLRDDVATAGRDLRTELLGTTEGALTALGERLTVLDVTVDERQSDVVERLVGLDDVVARSTGAT